MLLAAEVRGDDGRVGADLGGGSAGDPPAEVEDVLYGLAAIAEAAVIAEPDATWGETGLAVVVTRPGHALTEAQVIAHCRERLARFKCPARVVFIDALPRNATGKVHKPTLRAGFAAKDSG